VLLQICIRYAAIFFCEVCQKATLSATHHAMTEVDAHALSKKRRGSCGVAFVIKLREQRQPLLQDLQIRGQQSIGRQ
jgi:hypothetical protein